MKKKFILIALLFPILLVVKNRKNKELIEIGPASLSKTNVIVYENPLNTASKTWQLTKKHWPIYVISTTKTWAKITDAYQTQGWIKKQYISKELFALTLNDTYAFKNEPNEEELLIKKDCIIKFIKKTKDFCEISINQQIYKTDCKNLWYKE